jgi:hypothetical protein
VKEWKAERYPQIIDMASQFGIPARSAVWMRMRFLTAKQEENKKTLEWMDRQLVTRWEYAFHAITKEELDEEDKKSQRAISALKDAERGIERRGAITDDMVARAKEYPIAELIDFDRTGASIAFCHPDQRPSLRMMKGKNAAYCFPCAKKFDPIDILRERDGLSFHDAVRRLS